MGSSKRDGKRTNVEDIPDLRAEVNGLLIARDKVREAREYATTPGMRAKFRSLLSTIEGGLRYRQDYLGSLELQARRQREHALEEHRIAMNEGGSLN